jgi:accessory gene regulator B
MEKLAHNLAEKIALQMHFDEDKKAVIAYGLTGIFEIIILFAVISVIGFFFDFWYESIIIFLVVGTIRKSTGGAHSRSMYGCILISVLSVTVLSSLSRYILGFPMNIYLNLFISLIIFILCFVIFYKKVPVSSPKKPINNPQKIKRLRNQSFVTLIIFFLISIAFIFLTLLNDRFYSIAVRIRLAMLFQLFSLTKIGAICIDKIDLKYEPTVD